jgi:hypothetical protein
MSSCRDESDPTPAKAPEASVWSAFLCDNEGRITRDFGGAISARSLVDLMESGNLMSFLESVRSLGATSGWQLRIHDGGTVKTLVLHGSLTPCGILVFATLTPCPECAESEPHAEVKQSLERSGFNCPRDAAVTQCSVLAHQEEETIRRLSAVVHDLKNPISSIISSCEYLEGYSQENLEPDQLELIHAIESSARTLLQLVHKHRPNPQSGLV